MDPVVLNIIGPSNPTSGGTDSVMKYLKKVDDKFPTTMYTPVSGSIALDAAEKSIFSVIGKGILKKMKFSSNISAGNMSLNMYIDGVLTKTFSLSSTVGFFSMFQSSPTATEINIDVAFHQSLEFRIYYTGGNTGTYNATGNIQYDLY
jgi:hypothetical protein